MKIFHGAKLLHICAKTRHNQFSYFFYFVIIFIFPGRNNFISLDNGKWRYKRDDFMESNFMIRRILMTMVMSLSFFGLSGQTDKFRTVDVAEFAEAVSDTSYVVLDVRTPAEHAEGHIPGTHFNIDVLEDSYTETALKTLSKDKPVALYCRSGNRSKNAARILAENGYQVLELGSGFRGWVAADKPIGK